MVPFDLDGFSVSIVTIMTILKKNCNCNMCFVNKRKIIFLKKN